MKRRLPVATLLCAMSVTAAQAATPPQDLERRVDRIFEPWTRSDSPGCAVSITAAGRVVFERGYGMADLEQGVANRPDTVFNIASVSKQFTSTAILLLAEQGKLSLDDDVRKYVPEVPDYGHTITLRHLANHTSGLRDFPELLAMAGWNWVDAIPQPLILDMISRQKQLDFATGTEYLYSNTGYFLLGIIVERISGTTLGAFADSHIFKPLDMLHTRVYDDRRMIMKNRAVGHLLKKDGSLGVWRPTYELIGDGAVLTTVQDLAAWERNFLTPRLGHNPRQLIEQLGTPGRLGNGQAIDYAMGLVHGQYRGLKTITHSGGIPGYGAYMLRFPQQQLGVYLLCNQGRLPVESISNAVADLYLADAFKQGKPTPLPVTGAAKASGTPQASAPASAVSLDAYAGRYRSEELAVDYRIEAKGGALAVHVGYLPTQHFTRTGDDRFESDDSLQLVFHRDANRKVDGFSLSANRIVGITFNRATD